MVQGLDGTGTWMVQGTCSYRDLVGKMDLDGTGDLDGAGTWLEHGPGWCRDIGAAGTWMM